jgi:hypothetical protein
MSLTVAIIVLIVLALGLVGLLTGMMSWPRNLTPHRARGGKPAARIRRFQRRPRS